MVPNTVAVAQPFLIFHLSPNAHSLTLPHRPLAFEVTFGLYIYEQVLMTGSQLACYWGPSSQEAQILKNSKFGMETRRRRHRRRKGGQELHLHAGADCLDRRWINAVWNLTFATS